MNELFSRLIDADIPLEIAFNTCLVLGEIRPAMLVQRLRHLYPTEETFSAFIARYFPIFDDYPLKAEGVEADSFYVLRDETTMPELRSFTDIGEFLGFECPGQMKGGYNHLLKVRFAGKGRFQTFYAELCDKPEIKVFDARIQQLRAFIEEYGLPLEVDLLIRPTR
jgi:hypothetical protein